MIPWRGCIPRVDLRLEVFWCSGRSRQFTTEGKCWITRWYCFFIWEKWNCHEQVSGKFVTNGYILETIFFFQKTYKEKENYSKSQSEAVLLLCIQAYTNHEDKYLLDLWCLTTWLWTWLQKSRFQHGLYFNIFFLSLDKFWDCRKSSEF